MVTEVAKWKRGERYTEIYEIIKKAESMSIAEIRELTDINYNTIRSTVIRLTNRGLIERVGWGVYKHKSE